MKKSASRHEADFFSKTIDVVARLLAILLNAGGAQAGEAVLIDRVLPGKELVDRQRVAAASLFEREQATAHGGDDFGLAANHPALRSRRREISDRQWRTVRPDDILDPRAMGLSHINNSHKHDTTNVTIAIGA